LIQSELKRVTGSEAQIRCPDFDVVTPLRPCYPEAKANSAFEQCFFLRWPGPGVLLQERKKYNVVKCTIKEFWVASIQQNTAL